MDHVCGLYRAVVASNSDPLVRSRLLVTIPDVHGPDGAVWAMPCVDRGGSPLPANGQGVWVAFEHGDPEHPVWMGVFSKIGGS